MIVLPKTLAISVGADRNVSLDFTKDLDADELFTGTPIVTPIDSGITVDNARVNMAVVKINRKDVAIGKAIQFHLDATGATAGTTYGISIGCGTTSTPSETPKYRLNVRVL